MGRGLVFFVLLSMFAQAASAQTAPETLAYMLFRVSVPPEPNSNNRTEILKSTPTLFRFAKFYTGFQNSDNTETDNITITQAEPCKFRVLGKRDTGNYQITIDNTLDFTTMSGADPEVQVEKVKTTSSWERYYLKLNGVKTCSERQSFTENPYWSFPASGTCVDHVYTIPNVDRSGMQRLQAAVGHFKQTYCKGRAF